MLAGSILEATACAACPLIEMDRQRSERVAELEAQLAELGERLVQTEAERDRAQKEAAELRASLGRLGRRRKRQAAPFSKGEPKPKPSKPGRRSS